MREGGKNKKRILVCLYTISWSAAQSDRGCTGVGRDPFFGPRQVWQTFFLFFQGREPCSALQISRQKRVTQQKNEQQQTISTLSNPHPPRKFLKRVRQKLCPSLFSLYPDKYWTVYTGRRFDQLRGSNLLTCGFVSISITWHVIDASMDRDGNQRNESRGRILHTHTRPGSSREPT